MWQQLTLGLEFDRIIQTNYRKVTPMTHEHYWDTPSTQASNLVAECQCGDQLFREGN
jgi:hypothetical protein